MIYAGMVVNGAKIQLQKIYDKINDKTKNVFKQLEQVKTINQEIKRGFMEFIYIGEKDTYASREILKIFRRYNNRYKAFSRIDGEDVEEFTELLEEMLDVLNDFNTETSVYGNNSFDTFNNNTYTYEASTVLYSSIEQIASKIKSQKEFNVLDLNAKEGDRLKAFQSKTSNLYGLSNSETNLVTLRETAKKAVYGIWNQLYCQHKSFDVVICDLRVSAFKDANIRLGRVDTVERITIERANGYVRKEGVLIVTLPIYRLNKSMSGYVTRGYDVLAVFKGNETEQLAGLVTLVLKSKVTKVENLDMVQTLIDIEYETLPTMDDIEGFEDIFIMNSPLDIQTFRGIKFDPSEIDLLLKNSGAIVDFEAQHDYSTDGIETRNPLLPFNMGQIGLILTSGCLDGIIEEGEGFCHMVKGRVSKKTDTTINRSEDARERVDVTTNRVEINILKPDGTFKTLV